MTHCLNQWNTMVADRDEGRVNLFGNVKLFFLVFIQRTCIWLCTRCWEYWINHKEQQNTKVLPRAQSLVLEEVSQCLLYKMVKMLHWKREKYHRNTAGDANLRKSGQEGNAWAGVQRGQEEEGGYGQMGKGKGGHGKCMAGIGVSRGRAFPQSH